MRDIVDIVKNEIVAKINNSVEITSVSALSSNQQIIRLCSNKWCRVGKYLSDQDHFKWLIVSIDPAGFITVEKPQFSTGLVARQILYLHPPGFLFGTAKSANVEFVDRINAEESIFPLIWLVEWIREKELFRSSIERESDIRVYFLDEVDIKEYMNEDFRSEGVAPMLELKDGFNDAIRDNIQYFTKTTECVTRPITRFGEQDEKTGYFKNILNNDLSGCEETITLKVNRVEECKC